MSDVILSLPLLERHQIGPSVWTKRSIACTNRPETREMCPNLLPTRWCPERGAVGESNPFAG